MSRGGLIGRAFSAVLLGLLVPGVIAQTTNRVTGVAPGVQFDSSPQVANFTDITSSIGLNFAHVASPPSRKCLIETMGSGVALFDYDNDGRLDIFVVNGAPITDPTAKGSVPQKDGPRT